MEGSGCTTSRPCHAMRIPLRLMFSVLIAQCAQIPGEVTWQGSCISIRGLSRLLIGFMFPGYITGMYLLASGTSIPQLAYSLNGN
jgi:hypothetical protein